MIDALENRSYSSEQGDLNTGSVPLPFRVWDPENPRAMEHQIHPHTGEEEVPKPEWGDLS